MAYLIRNLSGFRSQRARASRQRLSRSIATAFSRTSKTIGAVGAHGSAAMPRRLLFRAALLSGSFGPAQCTLSRNQRQLGPKSASAKLRRPDRSTSRRLLQAFFETLASAWSPAPMCTRRQVRHTHFACDHGRPETKASIGKAISRKPPGRCEPEADWINRPVRMASLASNTWAKPLTNSIVTGVA